MSTSDEQLAAADDRVAADQRRLDQVGARVAEARQAAADVADRENISDDDRQAAVNEVAGPPDGPGDPGDDPGPGQRLAGEATGEGAQDAPG